MKIIAINGSPRKKWNTATLLQHALDGAAQNGADTKLVHLYDLDYKGCISCFQCKKIGGKSYGRCAVRDGLTPLLEDIASADALILGSPMYLNVETGEMRSFMERLLFAYYTYTPEMTSLAPKPMPTALIYTMGATEEFHRKMGQDRAVEASKRFMTIIYGSCEVLISSDTLQFDDYSKYLSTRFDPEAKAERREKVFPQDCEKARQLGAKLAQAAVE